MRELKANEKILKEYERFILIEVKCPNNQKYRTTIDKWTPKDVPKIYKSNVDTLLERNYWRRV